MNILSVKQLSVQLPTETAWQTVVNAVDLNIERGQVHGVVGESGSGKSMTAKALMGLLPAGARQSGSISLAGQAVHQLSEAEWREWRGKRISII